MTMTTALASVPFPPGARMVHDWEDTGTAQPYRYFEMPRTIVHCRRSTIAIWAGGLQRADGTVEAEIAVSQLHSDEPLTIAESRQVARAIMAAAELAELAEGQS